MKISELKTPENVQTFFYYLVNDLKLNFHIDTHFADYIAYSNNKPLFSKKQAEKLDKMISKAFDICEKNNVDIYELGLISLQNTL